MPTIRELTANERDAWRKQNIADLLYQCDRSFAEKLELNEGMAEVAAAFYKKPLPGSEKHVPLKIAP